MLEEDEKFYATFPDALRAAIEQQWRYNQAPFDQYFQGHGFQYCPGPGAYSTGASIYHPHAFDAPSTYWECPGHTPANARCMSDASYGYSSSMERPLLNVPPLHSIHHGWADRQRKWEVGHLVQHYSVRVCYFSFGVTDVDESCLD